MRVQTKLEEQFNSWTHGVGAALGIAALVLLIVFSDNAKPWSLFSVVVYGIFNYYIISSIYILPCSKGREGVSITLE